jgi:hypothetical protein
LTAATVSIFSLFPTVQRITVKDRVLSFLDPAKSLYGLAVALTTLHVGATLRIASDDAEVVSTSAEFDPSVCFLLACCPFFSNDPSLMTLCAVRQTICFRLTIP